MGSKSSKYPRQLFAFRHWITIMLLFSNAFQKKMRVRVKSGDWVFGSCSLLPKYGCYIHLLCYSVSWKTGWLHFLVPVKYMMYFWPLVVTLRMYLVQPVVLFFVPNCLFKIIYSHHFSHYQKGYQNCLLYTVAVYSDNRHIWGLFVSLPHVGHFPRQSKSKKDIIIQS